MMWMYETQLKEKYAAFVQALLVSVALPYSFAWYNSCETGKNLNHEWENSFWTIPACSGQSGSFVNSAVT